MQENYNMKNQDLDCEDEKITSGGAIKSPKNDKNQGVKKCKY